MQGERFGFVGLPGTPRTFRERPGQRARTRWQTLPGRRLERLGAPEVSATGSGFSGDDRADCLLRYLLSLVQGVVIEESGAPKVGYDGWCMQYTAIRTAICSKFWFCHNCLENVV